VRWCTAAFDALSAGCHWGRLTMSPDMDPYGGYGARALGHEVPAEGRLERPQRVQVDRHDLPRCLGATSSAGASVHAPLLFTSTSILPHRSSLRAGSPPRRLLADVGQEGEGGDRLWRQVPHPAGRPAPRRDRRGRRPLRASPRARAEPPPVLRVPPVTTAP